MPQSQEPQVTQNGKSKIDFLVKALDDAQNTVRFTDGKAGAVIAFWGIVLIALNNSRAVWYPAILHVQGSLERTLVGVLVVLLLLFLILSVWLCISVFIPKNAPSAHIDSTGVDSRGLFYLFQTVPPKVNWRQLFHDDVDVKLATSTREYLDALDTTPDDDLRTELVVELQKVSFIRTMKILRVNRAILLVRHFLLALLVLAIFLFVNQSFRTLDGGIPIVSVHLNTELFIIMYIAHKAGDYLFQTDRQAVMKSKQFGPLTRHCLVYTAIVMGAAYVFIGYFRWAAILGLFLSHMVLDNHKFEDWWAKVVKRIADPKADSVQAAMLELDQAFHYIVLFIIAALPK